MIEPFVVANIILAMIGIGSGLLIFSSQDDPAFCKFGIFVALLSGAIAMWNLIYLEIGVV